MKGESEGNANLSGMLGVMSEVTRVRAKDGGWGKGKVWSERMNQKQMTKRMFLLASDEGTVSFLMVSHTRTKCASQKSKVGTMSSTKH